MLPSFDADPGFSRAPDWQGLPVETGALARRARHPLIAAMVARDGNSVATRFAAQLVDLAELLGRHDAQAVRQHTVAPGVGIGLAETARGLLLHQAQVGNDGRVERYRVIAPTEWNFHPSGALTLGLVGRRATDADAARRDATLLAQALDPCVAFSVEVAYA
jgi:Ni,Fe-hydrogenase I large subunit